MNNEIAGEIPRGIGDLPDLEALLLWNNSLTGSLPPSLGSNSKLEKLDVSSNSLTGPIPRDLCRGNRLVRLILFSNRFNSTLPPNLANCSSLWRVRIESNRISGVIPTGFGQLPNLTFMDLSDNNFSGGLPPDLGDAIRLQLLNVSKNPLKTSLPNSIWRSKSLQIFSASSCGLVGEIPRFDGGCENLYRIEIEDNELRGEIPIDIGECQKLLTLKLDRNRLTGPIPVEISNLPSITDVDLSFNELSGPIPSEFGNCTTLENFNVSFNELFGRVPFSTVLSNLHPSSFAGNRGLCGPPVGSTCPSGVRKTERRPESAEIVWIAVMAVGVASSDWILGMGSTGTVYRAEMPGGEIIAVKKLWAPQKEHKQKKRPAILAEVEVLGSVKHRNIVKLLGYCNNRDTTMLLYEYMPNGSLDDLLHRKNPAKGGGKMAGDWGTRYRIAVGVAEGVSYLHHDCEPAIVHRDVKGSNVLLDGEMEARVADFGVAKLVASGTEKAMSVVAGSYGYIAPEYAYTLRVDEKSDIYSYGVVLLEIVTGRRAVEAEFGEGKSIVDWVREKASKGDKGSALELLDPNIIGAVATGCKEVREEMMLLLRVAMLCTSRNPAERPSMRDVLSMLRSAKPQKEKKGAVGEKKKKQGD
ncbi:uncharacterized protein A4U43_C01F17020 [Asparagus officinalis]|uniref:Protein kinase domain-containing protein n=2 Tax=Asparagus officinalis TaxID=4686 RepID=A0A5P1FQ82_ASPOF|nr:uncharacterized protein A4U43_C01F17020 [Asparagus officinalis]